MLMFLWHPSLKGWMDSSGSKLLKGVTQVPQNKGMVWWCELWTSALGEANIGSKRHWRAPSQYKIVPKAKVDSGRGTAPEMELWILQAFAHTVMYTSTQRWIGTYKFTSHENTHTETHRHMHILTWTYTHKHTWRTIFLWEHSLLFNHCVT